MTTYNILSTALTNRDANPKVLTDAAISNGHVAQAQGYVQTNGGADGIGSTYRLCSVPSNARISSVDWQTSGLGTSCTLDIGVWYPTYIPVGAGLAASSASAVINTTLFASGVAASSAVAVTNLMTTANVAINNQEKELWELAGLTSDPGINLDIVAYVKAAVALQGYVGMRVGYVR
jgi:hypothetical protein